MDANTMRARFLLGYEGANAFNRTFNDREIEAFLNKAQLEFTKKRYAAYKNRINQGLGDSDVRNAELSGLITAIQKVGKQFQINGTAYNVNSGTENPFLAGTMNNGALRRPDLDAQLTSDGEEPTDHFGIFVSIPDECMYILTETVDTRKDTTLKYNIDVKEVSYAEYRKAIYGPFNKPYKNLCWAMDWGGFTPGTIDDAGSNTDSTKNATKGDPGPPAHNMQGTSTHYYNGAADTTKTVTINTSRVRHLIAGKDWDITGYYLHYVKTPSAIEIDVQTPGDQRNCMLPEFVHQEIVDMAVLEAAVSIIPEPNKYQVHQIETKENE